MLDVAHDLARPPIYITKFFGFELGAQAKVVGDGPTQRHIVNGAHDKEKLQDLLDVFINKFVLCGECKNPETALNIKGQHVVRECKACGKRTEIDKGHKLSSFIVKSPPGGGNATAANGKKGGKKSRKGKHNNTGNAEEGEQQQNGNGGGDSPVGSDQGDDEETIAKINAEAAELAEPETKLGEDEWGVDTSAAAVQARQKALEDAMGKVALGTPTGEDDDEEEDPFTNGGDNPYDQLGTWIQAEHKENGSVPDDIEIYKKAKELGIEAKSKTLTVLVQCVFTENICKEIPKRSALFHKVLQNSKYPLTSQLIDENPKAEKNLLGGLERFIGLTHPDLVAQVPKILLAFYNGDVLTEEALLKWGSKKSSSRFVDKETSRKVRKAAAPFLKWLEEAEEE